MTSKQPQQPHAEQILEQLLVTILASSLLTVLPEVAVIPIAAIFLLLEVHSLVM